MIPGMLALLTCIIGWDGAMVRCTSYQGHVMAQDYLGKVALWRANLRALNQRRNVRWRLERYISAVGAGL